MTLYHHVASKDALLDLLQERLILAATAAPDAREGGWRERLAAFARHFHAALLEHPRLVPLLATRPLRSPAALAQFAGAASDLGAAGFKPLDAYFTLNALALLAVSHALAAASTTRDGEPDTASGTYPAQLAALFPVADAFAHRQQALFGFALETFLDGLATRRAAKAPAP